MDLKKLEVLALRVRIAKEDLDRASKEAREAERASRTAFENEGKATFDFLKWSDELRRYADGTTGE